MATCVALSWMLSLSGCGPQGSEEARPPEPAGPETAEAVAAANHHHEWSDFVNGFIERHFEFNPTSAVRAGRHEYDGRLPDWSSAGLAAYVDWLDSQRREALAFTDDGLSPADRFQRDYLVSEIDDDLFWIRTADDPHRNPMFYTGAISPSVYVTRPYAPLSERLSAYVRYANNLPDALDAMRGNLRTPLPRTFVETAYGITSGLAGYLRDTVPGVFAEVQDDALQESFTQANAGAVQSLQTIAEWFDGLRESATDDYALGTETYRRMLWDTERVDMPLDQVRRIGEADLARNLAALAEACAVYAPEATVSACVEQMNADKPGGGPVEAARKQLERLRGFVGAHDLVTIPGEERAEVAQAPPYKRFNFAYIEIPGPYEKNLPSVYYIAPPDPEWPEAKRAAYVPGRASLLFTSVHEVWPGHFLNFLHANRAESVFGRLFVGYAFSEGWAHYTEEMMWDAGLGEGDPEVHIGQLTNALLRDVRFLSSLGLHTGGMSVAESQKLFEEKAFQDEGNAQQQAYRGTYDPAYLNYTIGKLMIQTLREDWTATRGGRQAWKAFHDAFLSYGGPPIPMVRRAMLGDDDTNPLMRVPGQAGGQTLH
ncbi:MAG: DUF885 domain-containing protein [Pseudomonadales bacterium]